MMTEIPQREQYKYLLYHLSMAPDDDALDQIHPELVADLGVLTDTLQRQPIVPHRCEKDYDWPDWGSDSASISSFGVKTAMEESRKPVLSRVMIPSSWL